MKGESVREGTLQQDSGGAVRIGTVWGTSSGQTWYCDHVFFKTCGYKEAIYSSVYLENRDFYLMR